MKKLIFAILFLAGVLICLLSASCTKENIISDTPQNSIPEQTQIKARIVPKDMEERIRILNKFIDSYPYYAMEVNSCYPEAVSFSGNQRSIKDTFMRRGIYYRVETIKYSKIIGEGATSGRIYKGPRELKDIFTLYPDNSWSENIQILALYWTEQGDSIIIDEHSQFSHSPTGEMTIDFNNIIHRCKP